MKNAAFSIEELFRFLDAGVSAFHSTAAAAAILEAEGYVNCRAPRGTGPRAEAGITPPATALPCWHGVCPRVS